MQEHHRRSIRLPQWDYTSPGAYFITIVTHQRAALFGMVVDRDMRLNDLGRVAQGEWQNLPIRFHHVRLGEFVILPNHMHGIIWLDDPDPPVPPANNRVPIHGVEKRSVGAMVGGYKSCVTRMIRSLRRDRDILVWQRNYYEHIIRDEDDLIKITDYIRSNILNWADDSLYGL